MASDVGPLSEARLGEEVDRIRNSLAYVANKKSKLQVQRAALQAQLDQVIAISSTWSTQCMQTHACVAFLPLAGVASYQDYV